VILRGKDGAAAECHPPFPPMTAPRTWPASPTVLAGLIAEHAAADRTVGVLLVRLGGFAAGVFAGVPVVPLGTTPANSSPLNTTGYQLKGATRPNEVSIGEEWRRGWTPDLRRESASALLDIKKRPADRLVGAGCTLALEQGRQANIIG
jgi:hypothetical protein